MSLLRQPFPVAVCGLLLAFGFQAFLVYGLYSGDWLGLYYTGAEVAMPPLIVRAGVAASTPKKSV